MRGLTTIAAMVAVVSMGSFGSIHDLCEGFLPENDLRIPIQIQTLQGGGVSEEEFQAAIDRVEEHYAPIIEELGGTLDINRLWENDTVNASARRVGSVYEVNMYGGLARHPQMDVDGFLLVACHEIGHHIGGAPKIGGWFNRWATNEGQADYFAGLRCLREIWTEEENAEYVKNNEIDPFLRTACLESWETEAEQNLCVRIGGAGMTTTALFKELKEDAVDPHFSTPDPRRVSRTDNSYPAIQCRLDTYFQSGLCVHDMKIPLSDSDVRVGTCTEADGFTSGIRPRCWYGEQY